MAWSLVNGQEMEQRSTGMVETLVKPVVYTQPDCPGCRNVKRLLEENGIAYIERDIVADQAAFEEFQRIGRPATPVTVIGDTVIWGFNKRKILRALSLPTP